MMNREKGLGERIRVGGEGAVEFFEFGFDDFRDGWDVEVIECRVVGDMSGSIGGWYEGLWIGNSGCSGMYI